MRDLCKSMQCNKAVQEVLGNVYTNGTGTLRKEWRKFTNYEEVEVKLKATSFENLIEELHLIGTSYFLSDPCKSCNYHSIASNLVIFFNKAFHLMNIADFVGSCILSVKEKKLGFDRTKTIKIVRNNESKDVLCYISAETEVCDVPKKQANSTGKGLKIISLTVSRPNISLAKLFDEAGIKNAVIFNWLKDSFFCEMNECIWIINNLPYNSIEQSEENCMIIKENADTLSKLADEYAKETRKILRNLSIISETDENHMV